MFFITIKPFAVIMASYQTEQTETLNMVRSYVGTLAADQQDFLAAEIKEYLSFRGELSMFLSENFSSTCSQKCFQSRLSACCSREGIVTFFADMAVQVLTAAPEDLDHMEKVLRVPNQGYKCIYLAKDGCCWHIKPIVCEMFLCDAAKDDVFGKKPSARQRWESFQKQKQRFTWPDRRVLFDTLEQYFIDAGHTSPLMYLHNSPGLLKVKKDAAEQKRKKV